MSKHLLIFLGISAILVAIFFYVVIKLVEMYDEEINDEQH